MKMKPMPYTAPFLNQGGRMNHLWQRWFTELVAAVEEIRTTPVFEHTTGFTMTQHDLGRVHIMDIGSSDEDVYLPAIDDTDVYSWVKVFRIGTGRLRIIATGEAYIEYSSKTGRIWCEESKRLAANMELTLVDSDKWALTSGFGIWQVV